MRYVRQQTVEAERRDEYAASAFQKAGEGAAHRVHEAAPRLEVARQNAARAKQEAQPVAHLGVLGVRVLCAGTRTTNRSALNEMFEIGKKNNNRREKP